jgi:hypothetical protein
MSEAEGRPDVLRTWPELRLLAKALNRYAMVVWGWAMASLTDAEDFIDNKAGSPS